MKITLNLQGATRTFVPKFISARALKDTIDISSQIGNNFDSNSVDVMINYLVKVYGSQFTYDDILDGVAIEDLVPIFQQTVEGIMAKFSEKISSLPNAVAGNQ